MRRSLARRWPWPRAGGRLAAGARSSVDGQTSDGGYVSDGGYPSGGGQVTDGGRAAGNRGQVRRRSLRTRLVVSAVVLIALVCAVIGTVTTVALRSYLYEQLDSGVAEVATRVSQPKPGPEPRLEPEPDSGSDSGAEGRGGRDPLAFLAFGGQDLGSIGASVDGRGQVTRAAISEQPSEPGQRAVLSELDEAQRAALQSVPQDGKAHSVDLPGLGAYRVLYTPGGEDGALLIGVTTKSVEETVSTLIVVELCVAGAGLVAAGIAGVAMVGIALRPLRRVAATATRVAELPLHSGEPVLHERVPDADPGTEVGQVGGALNRMLDHVHSALSARQESETRVRQFVADASHELRTPLASIRGYAELTRRGPEEIGPDTRHALGRIESEASRMTGLVEDLLLLARLDAGRPLSYADVDLSPLVVDAVGDARAAGPGHRWRLDLPGEPVLVRGDAARLTQVLVNLLANARTHTPTGTTVTARVVRGEGEVRLEVEDDGPGIGADVLPHVFERFARGDASRARNVAVAGGTAVAVVVEEAEVGGGAGAGPQSSSGVFTGLGSGSGLGSDPGPGLDPDSDPDPDPGLSRGHARPVSAAASTGLGLAIVRAVVAAHGGAVGVRSVPGRTVFVVRLPGVAGGEGRAELPVSDSQMGHRLSTPS